MATEAATDVARDAGRAAPRRTKVAFWLALGVILVLSFRLYSSRYYVLLTSDDALNVLMTKDYSLPADLYCWGQDRGGTLIPLLGQFFYGVLHLPPVWAVSLSNYLLVVLGGLGFMRLFRTRSVQLLFAMGWLLPPWRFVDMLRFPFGVQYALVGIALLVLPGLRVDREGPFRPSDHLRMLLLVVLAVAAVWASDLAGLTLVAGVMAWLLWQHKLGKAPWPRKEVLWWCAGGAVVGAAFLLYAKSTATVATEHYQEFNGLAAFLSSAAILLRSVRDLLAFRVQEPYMGTYAVLATLTVIAILAHWRRWRRPDPRDGMALFLALDALFLLVAVLTSKWAALNMLNRRYFIGAYISLFILMLLLHELTAPKQRRRATPFLWATVIAGALSGPLQMKYVWPRTLQPRVDLAAEFLQLGTIGLIGEYGNAHVASVPDPARIAAVSHDGGPPKHPGLVAPVFDGRDIYVIKDMWLDSFPDTLSQFGHRLVRAGEPFNIAGCTVNRYEEVP